MSDALGPVSGAAGPPPEKRADVKGGLASIALGLAFVGVGVYEYDDLAELEHGLGGPRSMNPVLELIYGVGGKQAVLIAFLLLAALMAYAAVQRFRGR